MSQFSDKGYIPKTQNEYNEELRKQLLTIDSGWQIDSSTPDGLKINSDAEFFANIDEAIQHCYDSRNPNAAIGLDLDVLASITHTFRKHATASTIKLTVTGQKDTIIPQGFLFDSGEGTPQFKTINEESFQDNTEIDIDAICTTLGAINIDVGGINRITEPKEGLEAVTNKLPAIAGLDPETDEGLRVRRRNEVSKNSDSQLASMESNIYAVDGVREVKSFENVTNNQNGDNDQANDEADVNPTMDDNSIGFIVDGGKNEDIFLAINQKRCVGIKTVKIGDGLFLSSADETESLSTTIPVCFSRPKDKNIKVVIQSDKEKKYDDSIINTIREYVMAFSKGEAIEGKIYKQGGYSIGENIPVNDFLTPINLALLGESKLLVSKVVIKTGDQYSEEIEQNKSLRLSFFEKVVVDNVEVGVQF